MNPGQPKGLPKMLLRYDYKVYLQGLMAGRSTTNESVLAKLVNLKAVAVRRLSVLATVRRQMENDAVISTSFYTNRDVLRSYQPFFVLFFSNRSLLTSVGLRLG